MAHEEERLKRDDEGGGMNTDKDGLALNNAIENQEPLGEEGAPVALAEYMQQSDICYSHFHLRSFSPLGDTNDNAIMEMHSRSGSLSPLQLDGLKSLSLSP